MINKNYFSHNRAFLFTVTVFDYTTPVQLYRMQTGYECAYCLHVAYFILFHFKYISNLFDCFQFSLRSNILIKHFLNKKQNSKVTHFTSLQIEYTVQISGKVQNVTIDEICGTLTQDKVSLPGKNTCLLRIFSWVLFFLSLFNFTFCSYVVSVLIQLQYLSI